MILMIFLRLSVHFNLLQNFILKDSLPWRIAAGFRAHLSRCDPCANSALRKRFSYSAPDSGQKMGCGALATIVDGIAGSAATFLADDSVVPGRRRGRQLRDSRRQYLGAIPAISASRLYRLSELRNVSAEYAGPGCSKSRHESHRPSPSALEISGLCCGDRLGRGNQLPLLRNSVFAPKRTLFQGSRGSAGLQSCAGRKLLTAHFGLNSFNPCGDRRHLMVWEELAGAEGFEPSPSSLTVRCPTSWTTPQR